VNLAGWSLFWTAWLVIAGASFALITVLVTVFGIRDLKNMFRELREQDQDE
jgi:hypothetical protein